MINFKGGFKLIWMSYMEIFWKTLLVGVIVFFLMSCSQTAHFEDPQLHDLISIEISLQSGNPPDNVTIQDLKDLTTLNLEGSIYSLDGIQRCSNLTTLRIDSKMGILDLKPIAELDKLTRLSLKGMELKDLHPLESLVNLTNLSLVDSSIKDITSLESLTNLKHLDLSDNHIKDISSLRYLVNLRYLNLNHNMGEVGREWLARMIPFNSIVDISPLSSLVELETLNIGWTEVEDIGPLSSLSRITTLDLSYTNVRDLGPLEGLFNLINLDLTATRVKDYSLLDQLDIVDLKCTHDSRCR